MAQDAAPVVTDQPVSVTVAEGESASFTAKASGVPAPSVQWQSATPGSDDFTNLDGATHTTVSVGPVKAGDDGTRYRAVFTNSTGTTISDPATLSVTAGKATGKPAKGVLSDDNGWDTGLADGSYTVTMNLWWGNNATTYRLYENGHLIATRKLVDDSPNAQSVAVKVTDRPNGSYRYTCELVNPHGTTTCTALTVKVTQANPGTPVLSKPWTADPSSYRIVMDMWWGTNATTYQLLQNGVVIDEQKLTANTPKAQHAETSLTHQQPGTYKYQAVLTNDLGQAKSTVLTVNVPKP